MHQLYSQFLLNWKLFLREKSAVFWTFLFPVLMLLAFGVIFRQGASAHPKLVWVQGTNAALEGRIGQALAKAPLNVERLSPEEAERRWHKGDTSVQLESHGDGLRLKVNAYLASQGMPTAQVVQQAYLIAEAQAQGARLAPVPVVTESPAHRTSSNYIAFLLPGLIGMNLLSMGLYAVGMVNVFNREKGIFRRLAVTPLPKWVFILAQVLQRLTVFVLQTILLLVIARYGFRIDNQGSWFALGVLLTLGAACFMAMGFALASFTKTHESFAAVSNAFFFPMVLFSGVYFALDSAPKWLQHGALVLPLSPYLKALRGVFNDGAGLGEHGLNLALVAVWAILSFGVAIKKFRWT